MNTQEEIARLAHQIYEQRGGNDLDNWLEAERIIFSKCKEQKRKCCCGFDYFGDHCDEDCRGCGGCEHYEDNYHQPDTYTINRFNRSYDIGDDGEQCG